MKVEGQEGGQGRSTAVAAGGSVGPGPELGFRICCSTVQMMSKICCLTCV